MARLELTPPRIRLRRRRRLRKPRVLEAAAAADA
jgi:hypothetical protein